MIRTAFQSTTPWLRLSRCVGMLLLPVVGFGGASLPAGADTLIAMSTAVPGHPGISGGAKLDGEDGDRQISRDGRWIVYRSAGGAVLLPGFTGAGEQVFLFDRQTKEHRLVSHAAGAGAHGANGRVGPPVLSADGRHVAFPSDSTDLVAGSTAGAGLNLYLWDRDEPADSPVRMVSHTPAGANVSGNGPSRSPEISSDGRYVAFQSDASDLVVSSLRGGTSQIYLWDATAPAEAATRLVSHRPTNANARGDARSYAPSLSDDGRYVTYTSPASDLAGATGDTTTNIYFWDREAPTALANRLVSHTIHGPAIRADHYSKEPMVSGDGRYVVYSSFAPDLVPGTHIPGSNVYLWDRDAPFPSDNRLVSHTPQGATNRAGDSLWGEHRISRDGRFVTFSSDADHLIVGTIDSWARNIYQWDRDATTVNAMRLVSHSSDSATVSANSTSYDHEASEDGRYVVFLSFASNLTDLLEDPYPENPIFLWDREASTTSATRLVTHRPEDADGAARGISEWPIVSGDGSAVAFTSDSTDLAAGDESFQDLFAAETSALEIELLSALADDLPWPVTTAGGWSALSGRSTVSANGRYTVFSSRASDVLEGLTGPVDHNLYLWDAVSRTSRLISHIPGNTRHRANDYSGWPVISADGRYVAYRSMATDLIPGASGGSDYNVYLWDSFAPGATATRLVSHTPGDATERGIFDSLVSAISADGRFVVYESLSSDLIDPPGDVEFQHIYQWDRDAPVANANRLVSHTPAGSGDRGNSSSHGAAASDDGRFVAFSSGATDLGGATGPSNLNVYLWDRTRPAATAVRLASHVADLPATRGDGHSRTPRISRDGRYVAYDSEASDLLVAPPAESSFRQVFLWDRDAPSSADHRLVSHRREDEISGGSGNSFMEEISADGRFVLYSSLAPDLLGESSDGTVRNVYRWAREAANPAANRLISPRWNDPGRSANGDSTMPDLSADGRYVTFESVATDLTGPASGESTSDVYRWDANRPSDDAIVLVSHSIAGPGVRGNAWSGSHDLSADGSAIVFHSGASNLAFGDFNDASDAFWWTSEETLPLVFADGFANGETSRWSEAFP